MVSQSYLSCCCKRDSGIFTNPRPISAQIRPRCTSPKLHENEQPATDKGCQKSSKSKLLKGCHLPDLIPVQNSLTLLFALHQESSYGLHYAFGASNPGQDSFKRFGPGTSNVGRFWIQIELIFGIIIVKLHPDLISPLTNQKLIQALLLAWISNFLAYLIFMTSRLDRSFSQIWREDTWNIFCKTIRVCNTEFFTCEKLVWKIGKKSEDFGNFFQPTTNTKPQRRLSNELLNFLSSFVRFEIQSRF